MQTVPLVCLNVYFAEYGADGYNAFGYNRAGIDRNGYQPRMIAVNYPVYSSHDDSFDESLNFRLDFWERYQIPGEKFQKILFTGSRGCDVILILASDTPNVDRLSARDYTVIDYHGRTPPDINPAQPVAPSPAPVAHAPIKIAWSGEPLKNVIALTDATFEQQVSEALGVVLVCAWAVWSNSARQTAHLMEEIAAEYLGKATMAIVNMDEQVELSIKLDVKMVPTLIFFVNGREYRRLVGALPKSSIERELERLV
jgi:thioredoxin 1